MKYLEIKDKIIIDIESLKKMKNLLVKIMNINKKEKLDEIEQMGAIQAFEVSYELVWKTLQKFLSREGKEAHSPREIFRLSAQFGYLDNPKVWFAFGEQRNLTVHTYQEKIVAHILDFLPVFTAELAKLIVNLERKI